MDDRIQEIADEIVKIPGFLSVYYFGSQVRREATAKSDHDLFVVCTCEVYEGLPRVNYDTIIHVREIVRIVNRNGFQVGGDNGRVDVSYASVDQFNDPHLQLIQAMREVIENTKKEGRLLARVAIEGEETREDFGGEMPTTRLQRSWWRFRER